MATTLVRFQARRHTAAEWTALNEVLLVGELGVETDTDTFKVGDGVTAWTTLKYAGSGGTASDPTRLAKTANLADLASVSTARSNLGLKSGATTNIVQSTTAPTDTTAIWIDLS